MIDERGNDFSQFVRIGIIGTAEIALMTTDAVLRHETCTLDILMDFHTATDNAILDRNPGLREITDFPERHMQLPLFFEIVHVPVSPFSVLGLLEMSIRQTFER